MGKIIKSFILSALFMALAGTGTAWAEEVMPDLSMENAPAVELSMDAEPQMPGRVESTGIYFEVKDSEWLNVSLSSSELIKLTLESVPEMITMHVEAAGGAATTQITIKGLSPQTTYHKYEDNYHNHEAFTTDDNGTYTYTQDLSASHTVFIQTKKSTKFIKDDGTGGDCYAIGIWNSPTKTCTLTMDLNETIQIDSDGITLDGNGHTSTGSKTGNGVYIYRRTGVTIKNLNIKTFGYGISLWESSSISLTNNYASNNSVGISIWSSSNSVLTNNTANSNGTGISVRSGSNNNLTANRANNNANYGMSIISSGNTLSRNTMNDNKYNINLSVGSELDNVDTSNLVDGKPIYYIRNASDQTYDATTNAGVFYCINCYNITIDGLTLTKNGTGIILWKTQNSTIKNVILSNNSSGIYIYSSINNTITNNTISNNRSSGISLSSSNNNALTNNAILSSGTGISLYSSSGNTLNGNNASNNSGGISIHFSNNNILTGNKASNNSSGISLGSSNNNILTGNSSSSNTYGISLSDSSYNTLSNNIMSGNIYNFDLIVRYDVDRYDGRPLDVFYDNNIDTSNLVDGKPIYYIRNASDQTYDATTNAGVFYCINCNNVTIEGLTLKNNLIGMLLWKTQNSKIRNVVASSNGSIGIYINYSSGNAVESNNASSNGNGIILDYSSNNTLKDNNVSNNGSGIAIRYSSNSNTITGNTTDLNSYHGIGLWENCVNNIIYNNNFLATTRYPQGARGPGNVFNLSAPIGGNYWINYDEPSEGCYDNNNDGFCDAPFGQDNLPWTKPNGWKPSDSTPPTTTASLSGTSGNNGWYLSDIQVTLTATDNEGGSGVAKVEYSFDATNWVTYSAPFTVSAEGTTTIYYKSADSAGNAEAAKSLTISIDKSLPTITGTATPLPNANGWYNTDVTVTFTCTDGTSGIAQCPSPITMNSEGAGQVVSGTAVDQAGNSATASVTLNIDKTLPVLTLSATPNILWPPNHEMVDVAIGGSATDAISHIASTEFVVTDEYGIVQPSITGFNTVIPLESWREGTDEDGRHYTITAVVTDAAGNKKTTSTTVLVPHDQGN